MTFKKVSVNTSILEVVYYLIHRGSGGSISLLMVAERYFPLKGIFFLKGSQIQVQNWLGFQSCRSRKTENSMKTQNFSSILKESLISHSNSEGREQLSQKAKTINDFNNWWQYLYSFIHSLTHSFMTTTKYNYHLWTAITIHFYYQF